jgi:hypothetical protein
MQADPKWCIEAGPGDCLCGRQLHPVLFSDYFPNSNDPRCVGVLELPLGPIFTLEAFVKQDVLLRE